MYLEIKYGTSKVDPKLYGPIEYVDSNYAGDFEDGKSVMGHCFFINAAIASWYHK